MTKKKYLAAGGGVLAILVIVILVVVIRRHDDHPHIASSAKTSPSDITTMTTTSATATSEPSESSTTAKPQSKPADAKPYSPRTPVRCVRPGEPSGAAFPSNDPNGAKHWVTVSQLSGACDGTSNSFQLSGIDTRLAWRSDAPSFAAFLLDQNGLDSTAGYADAECAGACSEYQSLADGPGQFKLSVQSDGGPWQVEVQEYR